MISYNFCVWLTSLCMAISRSIHVVENGICCVLFYGWILFHHPLPHTPHIFFIHSPTDGHLGCFRVWLLSTVLQWTWAEPLLLRYRPLCYVTHSSSLSLWLSPSRYAPGLVTHFKHSLTITTIPFSPYPSALTTSKSGSMQSATTALSVSMLLSPGGGKSTVVQDRIILKRMVSVEYCMVVIYARNL